MATYVSEDLNNPELYMQVKLYTGNGSDDHAITFDNTDTSMQADMIWFKSRSNSGYNHCIVDSVRGVTKIIRPNTTGAEGTYSDALKSFDSNGFTLDDDSNGEMNKNTYTQVAWCWKESATAGFDIVSWSSTGSTSTQSHSLGVAPDLYIIKNRSTSGSWFTYTTKIDGSLDYLLLNDTDAKVDFGLSAPTSSVFSTDNGSSGNNMICYAFVSKQGYSKFGSYTGNGNADGTFVYTGFRPAFILRKESSNADVWIINDTKRNPINDGSMDPLYPAADSAEPGGVNFDILSNGFKIRNTDGDTNTSGATFIYAAFAEAPFVNSNGVPCNAR